MQPTPPPSSQRTTRQAKKHLRPRPWAPPTRALVCWRKHPADQVTNTGKMIQPPIYGFHLSQTFLCFCCFFVCLCFFLFFFLFLERLCFFNEAFIERGFCEKKKYVNFKKFKLKKIPTSLKKESPDWKVTRNRTVGASEVTTLSVQRRSF